MTSKRKILHRPHKPSRRPTKKLFKEYHEEGTEDIEHWRQTFVDTQDPTEYEAAILLTGSWEEWQRIKKEWPYFREILLPEWKMEQEIKMRSLAVRAIVRDANSSESKSSASSAKWIAEGRFNPRAVGRPSKDRVSRETAVEEALRKEIEEDIERVQSVSGGTSIN